MDADTRIYLMLISSNTLVVLYVCYIVMKRLLFFYTDRFTMGTKLKYISDTRDNCV